MVDYEKLKRFAIPDVRQTLTKRDTVLYALSVGFGQDPMGDGQLDFVDQKRGLVAVPSMAVVLGYPGFWLSNPATGVDPKSVLHGEQSIELFRPLPVEGEIIGRTRVTELIDKGVGRGALLYSEKHVTDAVTGELLAVTTSTTFLRGAGGFGGPSGPVKSIHSMPDGDPDITVELPTRPEQALIYRLNGDDNSLHADPEIAKQAGFPRPILHGLCTFGIACHALVRTLADYRAGRMKRMRVRFSAPVFPGETIRVEVWNDGSFRCSVVERDLVVIDNGHVEFD
ncbi:MaoC family dehydratase [Paraburkholderia dipogonis]|uniref:MaoC family dehydratase n=1 Tax=Paraburkholderia dipogonis TaxID=1211383 RepID=UPI0038BBA7B1